MDSIAQIIYSGIIIGILVSAPMGPVGMLIIQRTLNKGRWSAFFTGIGAAFSDLFYCLVVGFGLAFVQDFLESNKYIIEIFGSLVIVGFCIWLFRRNPARSLQKRNEARTSVVTDTITGFLFTISNPLITFFIIGLFSRLNFMQPTYTFYHYIIGFASIFCGALLWWYLITTVVNKIRKHFNVRSMWLLNRIIGSILMIMAIVGIYNGITGLIDNTSTPDHIAATHSSTLIITTL